MSLFNSEKESFIRYRYMNDGDPKPGHDIKIITSIHEDRSGGIFWVGTWGGLLHFDPKKQEWSRFFYQPGIPGTLSSNRIRTICQDQTGLMWIGTEGGGLNSFDPKTGKFSRFLHQPDDADSISDNTVRAVFEDNSGNLWVGTWEGLDRLDRKTNTFIHYRHSPEKPRSLSDNRIRSIFKDSKGRLWIGTNGGGLNQLKSVSKRTFDHYFHHPNNPLSLSHNTVISIMEDRTGCIWIGTWGGGINRIDPQMQQFAYYISDPSQPNSLSSNDVSCLYQDRERNLWIGTWKGGLNLFLPEKNEFVYYINEPQNPKSISDNGVTFIHPDREYEEFLWVGTYNSNNTILGILEDKNRNLWLSTFKGLSRFNPARGEFKNYFAEDGLQHNEFNQGAFYKGRDGRFYFGGINGFNVFVPEKIKKNDFIPPVVITDFNVLNREDFQLEKSILETEEITLLWKDVFSFEFAALNYTSPGKNRYAYQLVGFIDEWIQLDHGRKIVFSTLPPGEYVLRVKGCNNDGIWNEEGNSIKIIITPPFYSTWWFRGLVLLFLVVMVYLWHQSRMKRLTLQLKTEKEMERIVKKYNISSREHEILNLVMKGKSNKEIEDVLFISMPTVKTHISNIYRKFAVKNRLELICLIQQSLGAK